MKSSDLRNRFCHPRFWVPVADQLIFFLAFLLITTNQSRGESWTPADASGSCNPESLVLADASGWYKPDVYQCSSHSCDKVGLVNYSPMFAHWTDKISGPVESALNSRAKMLQIGCIFMILALAVIWWRRT